MEALNVFDKHYKLFIGAVIGAIVISIGIMIAVPIAKENNRPTILEISVAPTSADINIDGKSYRNGAAEFEPGEHKVAISADGFTSKEFTVEAKAHAQTTVASYLVHEEEGLAYYERSAADLDMLRLSKDDAEVAEFLNKYDEKIKIRELLPINASYNLKDTNPRLGNYMIFMNIADGSMNKDCHYAFCLLVTGDRKNPERVKEMLKINGYNYDDYEVVYE